MSIQVADTSSQHVTLGYSGGDEYLFDWQLSALHGSDPGQRKTSNNVFGSSQRAQQEMCGILQSRWGHSCPSRLSLSECFCSQPCVDWDTLPILHFPFCFNLGSELEVVAPPLQEKIVDGSLTFWSFGRNLHRGQSGQQNDNGSLFFV